MRDWRLEQRHARGRRAEGGARALVWCPSVKRHLRWLTFSLVRRKPIPHTATLVPPVTGPSFGLTAVTMKCT